MISGVQGAQPGQCDRCHLAFGSRPDQERPRTHHQPGSPPATRPRRPPAAAVAKARRLDPATSTSRARRVHGLPAHPEPCRRVLHRLTPADHRQHALIPPHSHTHLPHTGSVNNQPNQPSSISRNMFPAAPGRSVKDTELLNWSLDTGQSARHQFRARTNGTRSRRVRLPQGSQITRESTETHREGGSSCWPSELARVTAGSLARPATASRPLCGFLPGLAVSLAGRPEVLPPPLGLGRHS